MSRYRLACGVLLVFSALHVSTASLDTPFWNDPKALIEQMEKQGSSNIVQSLWHNQPAWRNITEQIASGEPAWVEVALVLRQGSDAGASSELQDAMFEALSNNPAFILQRAEPEYPLPILCGGRTDPLATYEKAITELNKTITAVDAVDVLELQPKKELCLAKLHEGAGHLKRFFGISEK